MQKVNLNLVPRGVPPVIYASQYDIGRKVQFNIYNGDAVYTIPDDAIVIVQGTKPDGNRFAYSTSTYSSSGEQHVSFSGSAVTVLTTEQMTAVAGEAESELIIRQDDTVIGTLDFVLHVDAAAIPDDHPESASEISAYQTMVDTVVENAKKAKESEEHTEELYNDTVAEHKAAVEDITEKHTSAVTEIQTLIDNWNKGLMYTEDITLEASKWVGTEAPYTYTLADSVAESAAIMDVNGVNTSADELAAIGSAQIVGGGSNILYAYGDKPEINIHVRLVYLKGE